MTVEMKQDGDVWAWSVYVNGVRTVTRESYQVASNIVDALQHPGSHWPSEADEVAESIRTWAGR